MPLAGPERGACASPPSHPSTAVICHSSLVSRSICHWPEAPVRQCSQSQFGICARGDSSDRPVLLLPQGRLEMSRIRVNTGNQAKTTTSSWIFGMVVRLFTCDISMFGSWSIRRLPGKLTSMPCHLLTHVSCTVRLRTANNPPLAHLRYHRVSLGCSNSEAVIAAFKGITVERHSGGGWW